MVAKKLLLALFLYSQVFATEQNQSIKQESLEQTKLVQPKSILQAKIKDLVEPQIHELHQGLIGVVFKDTAYFIQNEKVNLARTIQALQDNGLLNLVYKDPISVEVVFQISNAHSLLLVVRSLQNAMGELGYSFSLIKKVKFDGETLLWSIDFQTNVGVNPVAFGSILQEKGIVITDIEREGHHKWTYSLDATDVKLDKVYELREGIRAKVAVIGDEVLLQLTSDLGTYSSLYIASNFKNNWYPHVVFYDNELNILKIEKKDAITSKISMSIPTQTHYIKILDKYTKDNMKYGFTVLAR